MLAPRASPHRSGKSDQYVTRRRIEVAQSLILRGRDLLCAIALRSGRARPDLPHPGDVVERRFQFKLRAEVP